MNVTIHYPTSRRFTRDLLWVCDACGAAEWAARRPAHECPARRDAWGKRAMVPLRGATRGETSAGLAALSP